MYTLIRTTKFKKDLKKVFKRNASDFETARKVLHILEDSGINGIPQHMKPHKLKGNYKDNWECHIKPDLLIIWFQIEAPKTIKLIRIGTHSDLF
ncbi:type II toxin-antitoxin system RelE/ParE family toxin [Marixanthomonas spongiae]|uniref:Type II toxin-antitoxin system mRNA interferase toxin, RelE/StbE family n=1 Tax=Marixanthomonas spongiae TaxID=2174845 RepID=A0A2U0I249_9FLAO|nr:type II toxin-antitoxin system YafQ family toxin [Marixanthomonas spongiae]PVW15144.1 type II toxin-antitoxin system mRNA interferase toxin, RelE/StbE family [Marixanthomonas spongiae]